MKRGIKYDFSLMALVLIPVGVSISVVAVSYTHLSDSEDKTGNKISIRIFCDGSSGL